MQKLNINLSKIDKTAFFISQTGNKFIDLIIHDRPDQYGNDGFVTQDIGKERRLAGERGPIVGNWKRIATKQDSHNEAKSNGYQPEDKGPF
jgi:hypothetical protein